MNLEPQMNFEPDMEEVEYRSLELDQEEHSFFPNYSEAQFDFESSDSEVEEDQTKVVDAKTRKMVMEGNELVLQLTSLC